MKIYELNNSEIMNVKGDFEYIGEVNGKVFVRGEALTSPFVESSIPPELETRASLELKEARERKEKELNAICDSFLLSFESNALGNAHIYDASLEDQVNLMGLIISQTQGFFRCKEVGRDYKENKIHTKEQLQRVYEDGISYKVSKIYDCGILKAYLLQLDNIEAINSVSWNDLDYIKSLMSQNANDTAQEA